MKNHEYRRDGPLVRLYNGNMDRLQKILSTYGICSRRTAETFIIEGRVTVNGEIAILGQRADPEVDTIEVDGKNIRDGRQEGRDGLVARLYYIMNKPVGVVTSNVESYNSKVKSQKSNVKHVDLRPSTFDSKTVRDLLPKELQGKIYPVGRLDKETSGLLLFTNDGVLAYRLTHPSFDHEKEYAVETTDPITARQLEKLQNGVMIDGEKTKPAVIKKISDKKFSIALTQGKNRQIRRMCQKVGAPLRFLARTRIMTLSPQLKEGEFRMLTDAERSALLRSVDL